MKLADAGEAAFQHLDIGERRDGANIVGGHSVEEAIHRLAPGPETVRPPPLCKPRHAALKGVAVEVRSEEHTSELPSLMRISYAVFCLKKHNKTPPYRLNYQNYHHH